MIVVLIVACQPEEVEVAQYDGTLYNFVFPENFGDPELPKDNNLTKEGVKLGKMLFFEKALSKDGTQACASCHIQIDGFSDKNQFSKGVDGFLGRRQYSTLHSTKQGFFGMGELPH